MSDSDHSSKTIAILVMIALLTVALLGAEAWNHSQRNRPRNAPAVTAQTSPDSAEAVTGTPAPATGKHTTPPPPPPPSGEVLLNE